MSGMNAHKFSGSTAWQGATRSLWYKDKNEDELEFKQDLNQTIQDQVMM